FYLLAFENAYASIQIFSLDFRAAGANAASSKTIGSENKLGAVALRACRLGRQRSHLKIAVDRAVHRLKAEVACQTADKIQVDIAVDGREIGLLARVLAERDLYRPIHGLCHSRAGDVLHLNAAIHVVYGKVSGYVLYLDVP